MRVTIRKKEAFKQMIMDLYDIESFNSLNGVSIDSRKIQEGDIFIPLKGERIDGHKFIQDVLDKGASLVFSEDNTYNNEKIISVESTLKTLGHIANKWRNKFEGSVIGITGSNGKTTTKDLIVHILSQNYQCDYTSGNHNSTIGMPLSLISMDTIDKLVILEMGSGAPGEIGYLCEIAQPEMGLITNITEAHIEYFDSVEKIVTEKSSLFNSLPADGVAFINLDDPYLSTLTPNCKKITYSFNSDADFHGTFNFSDVRKDNLTINGIEIHLPYGGNVMAQNVIAAFSVAFQFGVADYEIVDAIGSFKASAGRGEVYQIYDYTIIDDTYNANPASVKAGIKLLSEFNSNNRRIVVIGDMLELGEKSEDIHRKLGEFISDFSIDAVFAFGKMTKFMVETLQDKRIESWHFSDQLELSQQLEIFIQSGDIIYFKGSRSMHMEDIIKQVFKN